MSADELQTWLKAISLASIVFAVICGLFLAADYAGGRFTGISGTRKLRGWTRRLSIFSAPSRSAKKSVARRVRRTSSPVSAISTENKGS